MSKTAVVTRIAQACGITLRLDARAQRRPSPDVIIQLRRCLYDGRRLPEATRLFACRTRFAHSLAKAVRSCGQIPTAEAPGRPFIAEASSPLPNSRRILAFVSSSRRS
jgi:hypothetical protein